ncbi:MAG TPA: NAD(P)-dependent oxidoreductase [Kiritimatiellia bacterium]|nr:NAD(P)-dependent oxidoreductase [Kiritimatiellia bacterium]
MAPGPSKGEAPRCFVLGGQGFIGSAMMREASRRGYAATAVTRENYKSHTGTSCDLLINANGNSRKYLANQNPALDFDLSVQSVMRSLEDFHTRHYVYISSIDVYSNVVDPRANSEDVTIETDRLPPYGLHKYQAEMLVQRYAPSWHVLRTGGMVGPGLWKNSIHDILKNHPLRVHPNSKYQYLHTQVFAHLTFDLVDRNMGPLVLNVVGDGLLSPAEAAGWVPQYKLTTLTPDVPMETYHVNQDRLKALCPVPATGPAVRQFIEDVLAGREEIA